MALYVVIGPPAAGKTTWVRQHAKAGDIVIDLDAIAQALGSPDPHQHPAPILRTAQRARSVAIDEALRHTSECDVYLIHTQPSERTMQRYAEHGAHVITVDPGRETVMARIADGRHHSTRAVAARWYAGQTTYGDAVQPTMERSRQW